MLVCSDKLAAQTPTVIKCGEDKVEEAGRWSLVTGHWLLVRLLVSQSVSHWIPPCLAPSRIIVVRRDKDKDKATVERSLHQALWAPWQCIQEAFKPLQG